MDRRRIALYFCLLVVSFSVFHVARAAASSTPAKFIYPSVCLLSNNRVHGTFLNGKTAVSAGDAVTLSGTIENLNDYPLSDLSLVARLVKLPKKIGSSYDTATDTVDRFVPLSGMYVDQNASISFSFTYHIPEGLRSGPYRIDIFLNGSDDFAVGGNEYVYKPLATYPLAISGSASTVSFFDVSTLTVNGTKPSAQLLSTISGTRTAAVSLGVITNAPTHQASIEWSLYDGNFVNENDLVATSTDTFELRPNAEVTESFEYSDIVHAKYLLVGKLVDNDKNSFVFLRIGRSDVVEPSIRSLYLSSFPFGPRSSDAVFGCLTQNYSETLATTTVNLSVSTADGQNIWSATVLNGGLSSYPFNIRLAQTSHVIQSLVLRAETLDQSGNVIASSSVSYICDDNRCPVRTTKTVASHEFVYYAIGGACVFVLGLCIFIFRKKPSSSSSV